MRRSVSTAVFVAMSIASTLLVAVSPSMTSTAQAESECPDEPLLLNGQPGVGSGLPTVVGPAPLTVTLQYRTSGGGYSNDTGVREPYPDPAPYFMWGDGATAPQTVTACLERFDEEAGRYEFQWAFEFAGSHTYAEGDYRILEHNGSDCAPGPGCTQIVGIVVAQANGGSDGDGDGVPDDVDQCPGQPGPASNNGCPEGSGDSDGDGIPDDMDECPNDPGPPGANGCPIHVGVINDSAHGLAEARVGEPSETCPATVEIVPVGSRLWSEIRIIEDGLPATLTGPGAFLGGLLPPGENFSTHWQTCFSDVNQYVEFELDTTTWRAETAQFLEILFAQTFFSGQGIANDVEAVFMAVETMPVELRTAIVSCFDVQERAISTCVLRAVVLHLPEFGRFLLEIAESSFIAEETRALFEDLRNLFESGGAVVWNYIRRWLINRINWLPILDGPLPRSIDRDIEATTRQAVARERGILRDEQRLDGYADRIREFEAEADLLEQRLGPNGVHLDEARIEFDACVQNRRTCPAAELRELRQNLRRLQADQRRVTVLRTRHIPAWGRRVQSLERVLGLNRAKLSALVDEVAHLNALKNVGIPLLGSLLQTTETFVEKYDRARNGTEKGSVFAVSCGPNDTRPACAQSR